MKKQRGNKRAKERGRYVRLPEWLLACPAWRSLDGNSRCVYIEMARRYRGPNSNNGKIAFSAREAGDAINASKDTGSRCLDQLIDHGFICVTRNSGFNCKGRVSREWRLTEFPSDVAGVSNEATKDFMRWAAEPPPATRNPFYGPMGETHSLMGRTVRRKKQARRNKISTHGPMGETVKH